MKYDNVNSYDTITVYYQENPTVGIIKPAPKVKKVNFDDMPLFPFPSHVQSLKIDVGTSDDSSHSVEWLSDLNRQDVGIIGIDPHPKNIQGLLSGNVYQPDGNRKAKLLSLQRNLFDCDRGATVGTINGRYVLINCAIDNVAQPSKTKFYTAYPDRGNSSLIPQAIDAKTSNNVIENYIEVVSTSLQHILSKVDWKRFPYIESIKIDTELNDLQVLKSCTKELLEKVVYFRVEAFKGYYPNHISETNPTGWIDSGKDITEYLRSNNFELILESPGDFQYVNTKFANMLSNKTI